MTTEPLLSLQQVSKQFPANGKHSMVTALQNLDLTLHQGEFISIVGPSGGGKSTLIDLVAGFTSPTHGEVALRGQSITKPGPDRVVVFQDHAIFPWYTALGNVAYGLRQKGVKKKIAEEQAKVALTQMGLADFSSAYPAALSGGMRQRVALARALVMEPEILLLDEPFASLDITTRIRLQDELLALWQKNNWSILFVTHSLEEAVYLSDRVVVLDKSTSNLCCGATINLPRPRSRHSPAFLSYIEMLSHQENCQPFH